MVRIGKASVVFGIPCWLRDLCENYLPEKIQKAKHAFTDVCITFSNKEDAAEFHVSGEYLTNKKEENELVDEQGDVCAVTKSVDAITGADASLEFFFFRGELATHFKRIPTKLLEMMKCNSDLGQSVEIQYSNNGYCEMTACVAVESDLPDIFDVSDWALRVGSISHAE